MRALLLAGTALLGISAAAHAQSACPAGTPINPNRVVIGTAPCTVAAGDAVAADPRWGEAVNVTAPQFGASPAAADNSIAINNAIKTGHTVLVPGWFHVTHMLPLQPGQRLVCMGRTVSGFTIGSDFSPTDPAVVQVAAAEPGAEIENCGWQFAQPPDQIAAGGVPRLSRAAFKTLAQGCTVVTGGTGCKYPPAIIGPNASRLVLKQDRISGAWDGISLTANPGGLWISNLEIGALDVGLAIDNALDFCHVQGYHFWQFGMGPDLAAGVFSDGNTFSAQLGRCDGLSITDLSTFEGRVQVLADATEVSIGNLHLDTDHSNLEVLGGHVRIANAYTTKTGAPLDSSILNAGGELEIGNLEARVSNLAPIVNNQAGTTAVGGGYINQNALNGVALLVSGGTLAVNHVHMAPLQSQAVPRSVPYVLQTGAGTLKLTNSWWDPLLPGYLNTTAAVSVTTDTVAQAVAGNDIGGWGLSTPAGAVLGTYGPNKTPAVPFTPNPHFTTPGDSALTFTTKDAFYWYTAAGIEGEMRLVFNMNAYTTATGAFVIDGLPFSNAPASASAADAATAHVTLWSGISLATGFTGLAAKMITPAPTYMLLYQTGSGKPATLLNATDIPPSTNGIEVDVHFTIPTN